MTGNASPGKRAASVEDLRRRLRHAWSYREKAKAVQARQERPSRAATTHSARAQEELQRARSEVRRAVAAEQAGVEALRDRQRRLGEQAGEGVVSPEEANAKNRRLTEDLARRLNRLSELGVLLSASSAAEAGGFVDLPLDQYPRHSRQGPPAGEQAFALVCAVGVSASIAVMWALQPGGLRELTVFPGGLFRALHFILPLVAGLFVAPRRASGPVFTVISAVLLLIEAVLAPGFMSTVVVEALKAGQYGRMALGVSAMAVYVAGAAALAELGVRRILPGNRRLRRWSGSVALVAGLIFAVAAAALAGEEPAGPVAVRFETHVTDPAAGVFLVICHNASDQPVHVLLPLPLDGAVTPEGPVYGARLYIRERGGDAFRLLERAGPWWQGEAGAGAGPDSIDVPPHAVADFTFRARRLAREGIEPEAIRLAYLREDGVVVDEFEHAFSERLTAPARQTRRARPSPAPSAVPRAQPAPQPRSAAPEERPAAARRRPGPPAPPIEVRYVGRINDRVVLNVRQGLASAQRVTAAKGDEIAPDWLLHDVDAAARLAVLRHSATGAEAVAGARRGWVELPASE